MGMKDWLIGATVLGVVGVGALLFAPDIMRVFGARPEDEDEDIEYSQELQDDFDEGLQKELARIRGQPMPGMRGPPYPVIDINDLIDRIGEEDDAFIVTDRDLKKAGLSKKERERLYDYNKIKDRNLERVIYGDRGTRPLIIPFYNAASNYVNTITPTGLVRTSEFSRLPGENQSNLNTWSNTINLYG